MTADDHRAELLRFLQGSHDPMEGSAVVGFALVVELIMPDGERGATKITSDANGYALPDYTIAGYSTVLTDYPELDDEEGDESV